MTMKKIYDQLVKMIGLTKHYHWWCFTVIERGKNVLYWVGTEKRNINRDTLLNITGGHTTIINSLYLGYMTEEESCVMKNNNAEREYGPTGDLLYLSETRY
jgi:hypothetical protein